MSKRTFGWVQNPNRLETLKKVVSVFYKSSNYYNELINARLPLLKSNGLIDNDCYLELINELNNESMKYELLKGKGPGKSSRKDALCTGIIQASIDAQKNMELNDLDGSRIIIKKPYSDDWTADGYLRWAISTGLLVYDRKDDKCKISDLGVSLVNSDVGSKEEKKFFTQALLSYPPVVRILTCLEKNDVMTKFELGDQLGFTGELGFSSIPLDYFAEEYFSSDEIERKKLRSDEEGDSDKYARTIANWLVQMNWLSNEKKEIANPFDASESINLPAYKITIHGKNALRLSRGYSSNPKIPKIVMYEMLATKASDADYIRYRRANILNYFSNGEKKILNCVDWLRKKNIDSNESEIIDDLKGLIKIGLDIDLNHGSCKVLDKIIGLEIPSTGINAIIKPEITTLKSNIRDRLVNLDHKYLVLVDLAYSDGAKTKKSADARDFEIKTAELFTHELGFGGLRLGGADKPDVLLHYAEHGIIIDNKSYKDGFSIDRGCADEMSRYIMQNQERTPKNPTNEWWKLFPNEVNNFKFLFVTSYLKGKFLDNLKEVSTLYGILGGAIGVDNLLYAAEKIKSGVINQISFISLINNNEIVINHDEVF